LRLILNHKYPMIAVLQPAEKCTNNPSMGAGLAHKIHLKVNVLLTILKRTVTFPLLALSFLVMTRQCYLERGSIVQRCLPFSSFDFHLEVKYSWVFLCSVAVQPFCWADHSQRILTTCHADSLSQN